jgi:predicted PurR-regulated permease PerM
MAEPTNETLDLNTDEARQLARAFAAPQWLQDLGRTSWLLVGFFVLVAAFAWLLGTTATIVGPVLGGMIIATVSTPIVGVLRRHRVPRAAGAAIVLLALLALATVIALVVIGGITAQSGQISQHANEAVAHLESWAKSVGIDEPGTSGASKSLQADVPALVSALTTGIVDGIEGLTSLAFALSFALLSTFFLLKDGPSMRAWVDGHLGVPRPVAHTITSGVIKSLRGYFRGVTIVATFNGVVVAIGALILGVPLAGTIGVVTFITAYVPFVGAFVAGVFAVMIALGAEGTSTALIMLLIVLLANGLLQNVLQPFAMGSALDLNPLVVLVVTIAAGCLMGMLGLVLAAPLTSAAVHIGRDLKRARERAEFVSHLESTAESPPPATVPA